MLEFDYEAANPDGQILKGQIKASSQAQALRELVEKNLTVVTISEQQTLQASRLQRKLKRQDIALALHELSTLLESGVSLADAVLAQSRGSYHPHLNRAFNQISRGLMKGESLLIALRDSELALPEYFYQLVEAGEMSGQLAASLRQGVEQMEYDLRVAGEFRNALIYPCILVFTGIAAVLLIFVFVVPKFANLLESDGELPLLAELVLRSGVWFNDNSWLFLGVTMLAVMVLVSLLRQAQFRKWLLNSIATLPVLCSWFSETDTAKWASVMAAMLSSKVELMDALILASQGVQVSRRQAKLEQVIKAVRSGVSLAEALEQQAALTPTGYNLIRVGEQSGKLPSMLRSLAKLYDESSSRRMKQVLTLIEPLAILLIGSVIGVIVLGIILAITSVNDVGL